MDKFFVITNDLKDKDFRLTKRIVEYLKERGKTCLVRREVPKPKGASYGYTNPAEVPEDMDCVLVLGGDGTLLRAARDLVKKDIPLLGVNLGTLGYLAEIDEATVPWALDCLISGQYTLERRMMLRGRVYRGEQLLAEDIALNDIVISREGPLRVVRFCNYVNGEFLNSYNADGIIISTPTGSTGYSLSAGGPIISPEASLMLMTPLAPHTLNTRSIIFPAEDSIAVEIGPGRDGRRETGMASFDGDTTCMMETGDRIVIQRSGRDTRIIKISNTSFLETLRKKMS
ncbi:MAG TPA: NAD(+)/NADH kinase [Candidatus Egerieimonas intestinavium]|uniref:NAD kinase n=1 Tax=Candidatus Egerieimonas intestinavium TaxID=2840777 RepID=A0A9D1JFL6_9FIRM|nr:NAD(+)/NADH kinase [Candidatus Egerieimonas intestinavium]